MGLYDKYQSNAELETGGTVLELADENRPQLRILLARAGGANRKFTSEVEKIKKVYGRQYALDAITDEKDREIMLDVHSRVTVLNWWTNVAGKDANGKDLPPEWIVGIEPPEWDGKAETLRSFNAENVKSTFSALPVLYEAAVAHAMDANMYNRAYIEARVKNS